MRGKGRWILEETKYASITADVEGVYVRRLLIPASYLEDQHCDGNTHKHPRSQ